MFNSLDARERRFIDFDIRLLNRLSPERRLDYEQVTKTAIGRNPISIYEPGVAPASLFRFSRPKSRIRRRSFHGLQASPVMTHAINTGIRIALALGGLCVLVWLLSAVFFDLFSAEARHFLICVGFPLPGLTIAIVAMFSENMRESIRLRPLRYSIWFAIAGAVVISLLAALCIDYYGKHVPDIREGMTATQVRAMMGTPYEVRTNTDLSVDSWYKMFQHRSAHVRYDTKGFLVTWTVIAPY